MVQITPVNESDFQQWRTMWLAYLTFYRARTPSENEVRHLWQRLLASNTTESCLVARHDNSLAVGFAHFLSHSSTWSQQPVCYLQDLYVLTQYRGKGLAKRLIQATYDTAKKSGQTKLYWQTQADNHSARRVYDKLAGGTDGFITYRMNIGENPPC